MTKVKICGLFREDDIDFVNEAAPDYIGFVFAKSRRQVTVDKAKHLRQLLNKDIIPVGVFVNAELHLIQLLYDQGVIQLAQLHGTEDQAYINDLRQICPIPIIKAASIHSADDLLAIQSCSADHLLLDHGAGGTGQQFDWNLLKNQPLPAYFLAGGLRLENVQAALAMNPFAVDVSSGVEINGVKDRDKIKQFVQNVRDYNLKGKTTMKTNKFGIYGGQYIPETLMNELHQLEATYLHYQHDETFVKELNDLFNKYAGRPSLLYYAERMSQDLGGAKIYLKREDLNHTGSHKINNVLGQVLLAKKMGKTRIIAETGAGQHGVATATAAALLGLECEVFMGQEDIERQALNVYRMELLGATVHPVTAGTKTLKDAVNATMREWVRRIEDTHYVLGSAVGPHPFPTIVRNFQSVISFEAREQILEVEGKLPSAVVACVGGGSNAIGMFYHFIPDEDVRLIGCEAAGKGIDTEHHAATITKGEVGVFHGMKSYFCQDQDGQISPVHSISAGLDYPGIGPEHAHLYDSKRAEYLPVTDQEAIAGFEYLARTEGIICAIESAHAIAYTQKLAKTMTADESIIVCLSGRGDKDVAAIARYLGREIHE